jgi:DNA polymerase-3 subunit beta
VGDGDGDGALRAEATNLDLTLRSAGDAEVAEPGDVIVPARLATDMVRSLASGRVTFHATEERVVIRSGRSRFVLPTYPPVEWPKLTPVEGIGIPVPAEEFSRALSQVVPAASKDAARPILTGVLVETTTEGLRLVATDSYRLAFSDLPGLPALSDTEVLVPATALDELRRLRHGEETLEVVIGANQIAVRCGRDEVVSRLLAGGYPTYRALIPDQLEATISVNAEGLEEALERVALVLSQSSSMPVVLQVVENVLRLSAKSDQGEAEEEVEVLALSGDWKSVAFNPRYLLDTIQASGTEVVTIGMTGALTPVLVRGEPVGHYTGMIMPIRI